MSNEILSAHSGIVKASTARLLPQLRWVKRDVVGHWDAPAQLVLQQAIQDVDTLELTWVDVPVCDEETGATL